MSYGRGGCLPKSEGGEVGLSSEWEKALQAAYEVGAGRQMLDTGDEDLMDAARLATPVGEGILWHPASISDINDTPSRTLLLFDFFRLGQASRSHPWSWWRVKGKRGIAHQYTSNWLSKPQPPARCGFKPKSDLERYDVGKCSKCERLDKGEPEEEATGTVAGVKVGAIDRNVDGNGG